MRRTPAVGRRILFFGGKGGVGKTTLASAAAVLSAAGGARTLLVSTDPAHSTGDTLGADLAGEPRVVHGPLWAMEIDPEREVETYIARVRAQVAEVTPPRLVGEVERQIDIARVSPGAQEAAVFERFSRILSEEQTFDRIIFDTAPTGHTLRLLTLPEQMAAWVSGLIDRRRKLGAIRRMWRNVAGAAAGSVPDRQDPVLDTLRDRKGRFEAARRRLTDRETTSFLFVLTADRLPILETHRAVTTLERYGIPIGGLYVNQLLPDPAEPGFAGFRRQGETAWLTEIERLFGHWPIARVPLVDPAPVGFEELRRFGLHMMASRERAVE